MALARGRFGIEYNPNRRRDDSSLVGWFVAAMLAIAAISFVGAKTIAFFRQAKEKAAAQEIASIAEGDAGANSVVNAIPDEPQKPEPLPGAESWCGEDLGSRPVRVRNLLLRLDEAERHGQIEMAISTIEDLRTLPGAFDLDERLARRLGDLNIRWLFDFANARWVSDVKVKKGDSASRIAYEHGSTLSSLVKLNSGLDVSRLQPGTVLKVMNHPRMTLGVNLISGTADLNLNGKFFRRYDIAPTSGDVKPKSGIHKVEKDAKSLLRRLGVSFKVKDMVEIDSLMPKGAMVTVLSP